MNPGDRRFNVVFGQIRARCRKIEKSLTFGDQLRIPMRAILVEQRTQVSGRIRSSRQACGIEMHQCGKGVRSGCRSKRVFEQNGSQAHGLAAKVDPNGTLGRSPGGSLR